MGAWYKKVGNHCSGNWQTHWVFKMFYLLKQFLLKPNLLQRLNNLMLPLKYQTQAGFSFYCVRIRNAFICFITLAELNLYAHSMLVMGRKLKQKLSTGSWYNIKPQLIGEVEFLFWFLNEQMNERDTSDFPFRWNYPACCLNSSHKYIWLTYGMCCFL